MGATHTPAQDTVPAAQAQLPFTHNSPAAQGRPQAPQLLGSRSRGVHWPLQLTSGAGQDAMQRPSEHAWPVGQPAAQLPQLRGSIVNMTHSPLHSTAGGAQLQIPPLQRLLPAHARSHSPQWDGSVAGSTQRSPHALSAPGQLQTPSLH
jgi:hypothetical protein